MKLNFCHALTLLFVAFKLTGVIDWSWWWVWSPFIFFALLVTTDKLLKEFT
jgi:hypothetical protein